MAKFDPKKLFEQAKKNVVKHKLFWVDDIIAYLPCSSSTFYTFFPDKSEELEALKRLLEENRIQLKVSLRAKWHKSNAPALQMALMKLISNKDELERLSVTYNKNDHTTKGESINKTSIDYDKLSNKELDELERLTLKAQGNQ